MFPQLTFYQLLFFYLILIIIWGLTIIIHEIGHFISAYVFGYNPKINIISINHLQVEYHSDKLRVLQRLIITSSGVACGFIVLLFFPILLIISDNFSLLILSVFPLIGYFWCARGDVKRIYMNTRILIYHGNILLKDEP